MTDEEPRTEQDESEGQRGTLKTELFRKRELPARLRSVLIGLAWLPLRILLVTWTLVSRFFLLVATLFLCGYFLLTTYVDGPFVMGILNDKLLGRFEAEHVDIRLLPTRVRLYNVRIYHPDGRNVITAGRVQASFDSIGIAAWGIKKAVGVSAPVPVALSRIRLDDYRVLLPFDPDGFHFHETFLPAVVEVDEGPSGPGPLVTLSRIVLGEGVVELVFPDWRMDVDVAGITADMLIQDPPEGLKLVARNVRGKRFTMRGLLPDPVRFIGETPSSFVVEEFRMAGLHMTAKGAIIDHPDFGGRVELFDFDVAQPAIPVSAKAWVRLRNPSRLDEMSLGHAFGFALARAEMSGSLLRPDFHFRVSAENLLVEDELELEKVKGEARLDLRDGVRLDFPQVTARYAGGRIVAQNASLSITQAPLPTLDLEACIEGLRPTVIAELLGTDGLADFHDVVVTGCCEGCRLGPAPAREGADGGDDFALSGKLDLAADTGSYLRGLGLDGVTAEGSVQLEPGMLKVDGLTVRTPVGYLSASARLDLSSSPAPGSPAGAAHADESRVGSVGQAPSPQPPAPSPQPRSSGSGSLTGRVDASAQIWDLAALPFLDRLRMGGLVVADQITLSGTLEDPTVDLSAWASNLKLGNEQFRSLDAQVNLEKGVVDLRRFCFTQEGNSGCLLGRVDLSRGLDHPLPIPFDLELLGSARIDLSALPFVTVPVGGIVHLESLRADGEVTRDWLSTVSSIAVEAVGRFENLIYGELSAGSVALTLKKEKAVPGKRGFGAIDASLTADLFSAPEVQMDRAEITLAIPEILGLEGADVSLPLPTGRQRFMLRGIEFGGRKLPLMTATITNLEDPFRYLFEGRFQVASGVKLRYKGQLDPAAMNASATLEALRFPLSAVPVDLIGRKAADMIQQTVVVGKASVANVDLNLLAERSFKALYRTVQGDAQATVTNLEGLPEPISTLEGKLKLRKGRLSASSFTLKLANGTRVSASGTIDPFRLEVDGHVGVSATRLSSLRTVRALELPLDAVVGAELDLHGGFPDLAVAGKITVSDLVAAGIRFEDALLAANGSMNDSIEITSERFFPGLALGSSRLTFREGRPEKFLLTAQAAGFDLVRVLSFLPEKLHVVADGSADLAVDFTGEGEPFSLGVDVPAEKLSACYKDGPESPLSLCMTNSQPARVGVTSKGVQIAGLLLAGGGHQAAADGTIGFVDGWNLDVGADVDLARIQALGEVFASYSGHVGSLAQRLNFSGPLERPRISGSLPLTNLQLQPRHLGSEVEIPGASIQLSGYPTEGNLLFLIEEDSPVAGTFDEGAFSVYGWFRAADFGPDAGTLFLSGQDIFYQAPGQFRLVVSPRVELSLHDLSGQEAGGLLSGDVYLSEGEFTRNFDTLIGSFTTAFSRTQERYTKPITELLPFLKKVGLDLRLHGGNFAVSSRFPFGETELSVNMDLKVGGTIEDIRLWDWMHVVPGGTITYKLVKRVFSINQGTVDFTGDPTRPYIDIEAQTEVPYQSSELTSYNPNEELWGTTVTIVIRLTGIYPNINPTFSSDKPEFDVADLQTLLLLGQTRRDLEGRNTGSQGGQPDITINLLTEDVAGIVSKLLLAPFVDAVSLGFTQEGGIMAEAATRIGRAINLITRVRQDSSGSEYSARIKFKITDRLSLEGRMKSLQTGTESPTTYEAKFRYVIPLE